MPHHTKSENSAKKKNKCKNLKRLSASKVLFHLYRKVCDHTVGKDGAYY